MRTVGGGDYRHDLICYSGAPSGYDPKNAVLIPNGGDSNDATSGGANTWISESQIRIFFGPRDFPACGSSYPGGSTSRTTPAEGSAVSHLERCTINFTNTRRADAAPLSGSVHH